MENHQAMTRLVPLTSAGALVAFVLFLGGNLFLGDQPLVSGRRASSELGNPSLEGYEREARLWQDPFQVLPNQEKRGCEGCWGSIDREQGDGRESASQAVLVAVLVRPGRDAEAVERRHRQRIAISSALSLEGYAPRSSELMTLLSVDESTNPRETWKRCGVASRSERGSRDAESSRTASPPEGDETATSRLRALRPTLPSCADARWIPVEWYDRFPYERSSTSSQRTILVAWLDEKIFGETLQSIDHLATAISPGIHDPRGARDRARRTIVFGPAGSGTLQGWLRETDASTGEVGDLIAALDVYLSDGLTEGERRHLRTNLTKEKIEGARAAVIGARHVLRGLEIRDSDPDWETSIVALIADQGGTDAISTIDFYLDSGLEPNENQTLNASAAVLAELEKVHRLVKDVRDHLARQQEFDPIWAGRVVTLWLLNELDRLPGWDEHRSDLRPELTIYSTRATAPLSLLNAGLSARSDSLSRRTSPLPVANFHQMVASDDKLAEIVLDELPRRGVDVVDNPRHHLAIIGEWDNLYGRLLPLVFEAEIQRRRSAGLGLSVGDFHGMLVNGWGSRAERVHRFSYLRGLDGDLGQGGSGESRAGDREGTAPALDRLERSEGQAQLDQIRRVGDEIARRQSLLRREGRGEIRAVGILGSDFYDKKLALQVLRPRFPGVIFFANDFDARYLHPADYKWFRGLLVASSYGLSLNDELQRHVPPLRDSYSTATLYAAVRALRDLDVTESTLAAGAASVRPLLVSPRLFEIGRGIAQDLTPYDRLSAIHPRPPSSIGGEAVIWLSLLLTFGSGLTVVAWRQRRRRTEWWSVRRNLLLASGAMFALVVVALSANYDGYGEPFALASGASIWPSEILRLAAFLLGCFLLARAMRAHAKLDRVVCERLGLKRLPAVRPRGRHLEWYLTHARRHLTLARRSSYLRSGEGAGPTRLPAVLVGAVWLRYRKVAANVPRLVRVLVGTALVLISMAATVAWTSLPPAPFRGEIARWTHYGLELASNAVLVLLTIWVLDVALFSSRLLRTLSRVRPVFPGGDPRTPRPLDELKAVRLAVEVTSAYGPLLMYPLLIGGVLIVSRSRMFDDWTWHWSIIGMLVLAMVVSIGSIVVLWRGVRAVRSITLRRLREARINLDEAEGTDERLERHLAKVIEELTELDDGNFSSTLRRTLSGALLAPLGGALIVALLDWMVQFGF